MRYRAAALFALLLGITLPAAGGEEPTTRPAASPVPQETLSRIAEQFKRPEGRMTEPQAVALYIRRMEEVLALGDAARAEHRGAGNLHKARAAMIEAANFLAKAKKSAAMRTRLKALASEQIADAHAPAKDRAYADLILTRMKVLPEGEAPPPDADEQIRAYCGRYAGTEAEVSALVYGSMLAGKANRKDLTSSLLDVLDKQHLTEPHVAEYLRRMGRTPRFAGRVFSAELTLLDGRKLSLPQTHRGKVFVVDFWATWCEPCVADLPKMKELYAKYKPYGVAFVGVSLDRDKDKARKFVKEHAIAWAQACSGDGWQDAAAARYGVTEIPSVWVVGRDGRIVSADARGDLEATIKKALLTPPPKDE